MIIFSFLKNVYLLFRVLPESPRWLLAMRKQDKLMEVLKRGAATNRLPIPTDPEKILSKVSQND